MLIVGFVGSAVVVPESLTMRDLNYHEGCDGRKVEVEMQLTL